MRVQKRGKGGFPLQRKDGEMRIAIVDDDVEFSKKVEMHVRDFFRGEQEQLHIWRAVCTNSEAVFEAVKNQDSFDVYLFDVEMPEKKKGGLELGKKVQELNLQGKIIFLTSYSKYAVVGYQMGVYYYILKNSSWRAELTKILGRILREKEESNERVVILPGGDTSLCLLLNDIMYLTKDKKYVVYHCLVRGTESQEKSIKYRERASLETVYARLPQNRFILITKGIIVNMKHVIRVEKRSVIMRDETRFSISNIRKEEVCGQMAAYWSDEM